MDYGKILSKAWHIIWNHKILWLFGFLASCGRGAGSGSANFNTSTSNFQLDESNFRNVTPEVERFIENLARFLEVNAERLWLFLVLIILVVLLISIAAFFVRVMGQVGLVRGALAVESGTLEADEKLTFRQAMDETRPYFWRLAGLRLLLFAAGTVIALIGVGILLLVTVFTLGIALLCFLPVLCILIPVSWAIMVVLKQAEIALLVDDLNITEALRRGYDVVRLNLGEYVVMALILMVGGGIAGFLLAIPQMLALAPIFAAVFSSAVTEEWTGILAGLGISVACLLAYWPVLLALRGVLTSYIETSWLLTFLETTRPENGTDDLETIEPELEPA